MLQGEETRVQAPYRKGSLMDGSSDFVALSSVYRVDEKQVRRKPHVRPIEFESFQLQTANPSGPRKLDVVLVLRVRRYPATMPVGKQLTIRMSINHLGEEFVRWTFSHSMNTSSLQRRRSPPLSPRKTRVLLGLPILMIFY